MRSGELLALARSVRAKNSPQRRDTRAANQERLAADAVDMLTEQKAAKNSQTFIDGLGNRKNS
jgi:hypothetical protein